MSNSESTTLTVAIRKNSFVEKSFVSFKVNQLFAQKFSKKQISRFRNYQRISLAKHLLLICISRQLTAVKLKLIQSKSQIGNPHYIPIFDFPIQLVFP